MGIFRGKRYRVYAVALLMSTVMLGCGTSEDTQNDADLFESIGSERDSEEDSDTVADTNDNTDSKTDENVDASTDSDAYSNLDSDIVEDAKDTAERISEETGILTSTSDINLTDTDGSGTNYTFVYDSETYRAVYRTDNWTIFDSYKINNMADMTIICQALIDTSPVHGRDMQSYREASDMAYEWMQHNVAYMALPDDSPLKSHAKDVDFDPEDQNKTFDEIYKDRTGKDLDIDDILTEEEQDKLIEGLKDMLKSGN